jgi:hypothetical protein
VGGYRRVEEEEAYSRRLGVPRAPTATREDWRAPSTQSCFLPLSLSSGGRERGPEAEPRRVRLQEEEESRCAPCSHG